MDSIFWQTLGTLWINFPFVRHSWSWQDFVIKQDSSQKGFHYGPCKSHSYTIPWTLTKGQEGRWNQNIIGKMGLWIKGIRILQEKFSKGNA